MRRTIQYAIYASEESPLLLISRVGSEVAWPVLDYEAMEPENNFELTYKLKKFSVHALAGEHWDLLVWTRKVPTWLKNTHREFWGFPPLKERNENQA